MRSPLCTDAGSARKVVLTPSSVPGILRVVMVKRWPKRRRIGLPPTSLPVRIFGPCKSARMPMGFSYRAEARRSGCDHAHAVFVRAVGKIQAGHVHAGVHQLVDHLVGRTDGAEGTDYFCSARIDHDYLVTEKSLTIAKRNSTPL